MRGPRAPRGSAESQPVWLRALLAADLRTLEAGDWRFLRVTQTGAVSPFAGQSRGGEALKEAALSGRGAVRFPELGCGPSQVLPSRRAAHTPRPGLRFQKAKLQCIPIFQNRKNKTNQSSCCNM